jgi:hypothetical protein
MMAAPQDWAPYSRLDDAATDTDFSYSKSVDDGGLALAAATGDMG